MPGNVPSGDSHSETSARLPLLAAVCVSLLGFYSAETRAWQTNISGSAGGGFNATAIDGDGNVVAAGYTVDTYTGVDLAVVKLDGASGAELWRRTINGAGGGSDYAGAVALDGSGNVVAAGTIATHVGFGGSPVLHAWIVIKLDGRTGAEMWRKVTDASAENIYPEARAVAVDGAGNVVAAGLVNPGAYPIFTVVKYDGVSGAESWRRNMTATLGPGPGLAVAADRDGNVVAAGRTTQDGFTVAKLNGTDGTDLWVWGSEPQSGEADAVAVDGSGDVVAAGYTITATGADFTAVKLDGVSGVESWRHVINGTAPSTFDSDEGAKGVAVDGAGNVVAAGAADNTGAGRDFTVVKFAGADGTELWRHATNGNANSDDLAEAVAVDGAGDVVAAGVTQNISGSTAGYDFTVVKLDAAGAAQWERVIGPVPGTSDRARAVRVDGAGDVIAAGVVSHLATAVKIGDPTDPPNGTPHRPRRRR